MKRYDPDRGGLTLDANFATHQAACDRCRAFDGKTSDLWKLCLEGVRLWKEQELQRLKEISSGLR